MSDDENESEETALYTITSAEGVEYDSTESISDVILQIHGLVHGPKKDLGLLRSLTEDLWSLAAINDGTDGPALSTTDTFGELDGLDSLPAGWTSDADESDDEAE